MKVKCAKVYFIPLADDKEGKKKSLKMLVLLMSNFRHLKCAANFMLNLAQDNLATIKNYVGKVYSFLA